MAQRKSDARTRIVVGLFVVALGIAGFVSLFIIGQVEGAWETKTKLSTDFKTITGLRKGSPVQLAGVEIGTVSSIEHETRQSPVILYSEMSPE